MHMSAQIVSESSSNYSLQEDGMNDSADGGSAERDAGSQSPPPTEIVGWDTDGRRENQTEAKTHTDSLSEEHL